MQANTFHRHKSWWFVKFFCFYGFLASARACMTLGTNPYIDLILILFCLILTPRTYYAVTNTKFFAAVVLVIGAAYTMHGSPNITAYTAQIFMIGIPVYLLFLKPKYQLDIWNDLTIWYAILLVGSIIIWICVYYTNIPLPHTSQYIDYAYDDWGIRVNNYLFLYREPIRLNPYIMSELFHRFNGFFLEPGHLGTITAFFLYVNGYNLKKKRNIVFLIAILLTFSAAAYVISILGYMFYLYAKKKKAVILAVSLIIIGCIGFFSVYNDGNNIFNQIIWGKLTRDEGAIEGRFSEQTQRTWDKFIKSPEIFWGQGADADTPNSAGYKVFIIANGILGSLLVVLAYWLIQRTYPSKMGYWLFVLYIISFLQRVYWNWDAFLDPLILGIPLLYKKAQEEYYASSKTLE